MSIEPTVEPAAETLPLPLDTLAGGASLSDCRLTEPAAIHALLKRLCESRTPVHLNGPGGSATAATVHSFDTAHGSLCLGIDVLSPSLQRLLETQDITAVAFLDRVRVQFDVSGALIVRSARHSVLNAALPREIYRFQRRNAFRVQPLGRQAPVARFAHPAWPDMALALRVLDLSIGGCALYLPRNVPPLAPGVRLNHVRLELEPTLSLRAGLVLLHVTSLEPEPASGVRLGCEMVALNSEDLRTLQRYIDQTQKRRRMLGG